MTKQNTCSPNWPVFEFRNYLPLLSWRIEILLNFTLVFAFEPCRCLMLTFRLHTINLKSLMKETLIYSLVLKCTSLLFRAWELGGWPYLKMNGVVVVSRDPCRGANLISKAVSCTLPRPFLSGHLFCLLQTVIQKEGENKLVTTFKGIKSMTEFNGDTIIHVSWRLELAASSARGEKKGEEWGAAFPTTFPGVSLCYHLLRTHYVPGS